MDNKTLRIINTFSAEESLAYLKAHEMDFSTFNQHFYNVTHNDPELFCDHLDELKKKLALNRNWEVNTTYVVYIARCIQLLQSDDDLTDDEYLQDVIESISNSTIKMNNSDTLPKYEPHPARWPYEYHPSNDAELQVIDLLKKIAVAFKKNLPDSQYNRLVSQVRKKLPDGFSKKEFDYLVRFIELGCSGNEMENLFRIMNQKNLDDELAYKIAFAFNLITEEQYNDLKQQERVTLITNQGYSINTSWVDIVANNPDIMFALFKYPHRITFDDVLTFAKTPQNKHIKSESAFCWPIQDDFFLKKEGYYRRLKTSIPPWVEAVYWANFFEKTDYYKVVYDRLILQPLDKIKVKNPETTAKIKSRLNNIVNRYIQDTNLKKNNGSNFNSYELNRRLTIQLRKELDSNKDLELELNLKSFLLGLVGVLITLVTLGYIIYSLQFCETFFASKSHHEVIKIKWRLNDIHAKRSYNAYRPEALDDGYERCLTV